MYPASNIPVTQRHQYLGMAVALTPLSAPASPSLAVATSVARHLTEAASGLAGLRPLEGFVIGVTADRRSAEQAELLRRRGASVMHGPTIATAYLGSDERLLDATARVISIQPDYLVATTGIGVRAWFEAAQAAGTSDDLLAALSGTVVLARGPKAAGALETAGLRVEARASGERLTDLMSVLEERDLAGRVVAVQLYGDESPPLLAQLEERGATVLTVPVYRWRMPDDPQPALRLIEGACDGRLQAVTFTAAPAVHNLFTLAEGLGLADELTRRFNSSVLAACVGPVCGDAARAHGVEEPVQPGIGRLGLLVRALSDRLATRLWRASYDGMEVVVQGHVMLIGEERIELASRERALLEELAQAAGAVVPRQRLLKRIWRNGDVDPHVLDVTVGRLRARMGDAGAAVQSITRRGYRLDMEIGAL
jgi:uroporphyrinogen-III synthase